MAEHTVLVVDDDPDIRESIEELLRSDGLDAAVAANGEEALRVLEQRKIHVILLDLMMPIMDGWEFRRRQQADPAIAPIPVVVITASGHTNGALKGLEILRKPLRIDDVIGELQKHCPMH